MHFGHRKHESGSSFKTLQSDITLTRPASSLSYAGDMKMSLHYKVLGPLVAKMPKWHQVGAAKYRSMIRDGTSGLPRPVVLKEGESSTVPSRDSGREIPIRIMRPRNDTKDDGVFLYIHGGGFVIGEETGFDTKLLDLANRTNLIVVCIGYRKAPEDPFPAAKNDAFDAVSHLITHSAELFHGSEVKFLGGESVGSHLVMQSYLSLANSGNHTLSHAATKLHGLVLWYGMYDLSGAPSRWNLKDDPLLPVTEHVKYMGAYAPGVSIETLRTPEYSPLYADLRGLKLPDALFITGTKDILFDETLFMSVRWMGNAGHAVVKIMNGAGHAWNLTGPGSGELTKEAEGYEETFVNERK